LTKKEKKKVFSVFFAHLFGKTKWSWTNTKGKQEIRRTLSKLGFDI